MKGKLILTMTIVAFGAYLYGRTPAEVADTPVTDSVETAGEEGPEVADRQLGEREHRRRLDALAELEDPREMLGALLAKVAEDPAPPDLDPWVAYSSTLLQGRFDRDPVSFERAREVLLSEIGEKQRWLLADALIEYSASDHRGAEGEAQRMGLAADLIDAYFRSEEPLRGRIAGGVSVLAGEDVGRVLAQGPNRDIASLSIVAEGRRQQAEAWAKLRGEAEVAAD